MTKHLPNAITLLNLWCGCGAVVAIFANQPLAALGWLAAAAVADFADGGLARLLKVSSPLGQQLDSLADMVSFGVAPGAIFFMMLKDNIPTSWPEEWALAGFVLSVFSGLRLGKFNIDTRQSENFIGLATPASTILTMGLWLVYHFNSYGYKALLGRAEVLLALVALISALLVSEIPMFSLKLKHRAWRGNEIKFIFVAVSIALIAVLQWASLAAVILLYILVNLFFYLVQRKTHS